MGFAGLEAPSVGLGCCPAPCFPSEGTPTLAVFSLGPGGHRRLSCRYLQSPLLVSQTQGWRESASSGLNEGSQPAEVSGWQERLFRERAGKECFVLLAPHDYKRWRALAPWTRGRAGGTGRGGGLPDFLTAGGHAGLRPSPVTCHCQPVPELCREEGVEEGRVGAQGTRVLERQNCAPSCVLCPSAHPPPAVDLNPRLA